jgi:hypothetical protein
MSQRTSRAKLGFKVSRLNGPVDYWASCFRLPIWAIMGLFVYIMGPICKYNVLSRAISLTVVPGSTSRVRIASRRRTKRKNTRTGHPASLSPTSPRAHPSLPPARASSTPVRPPSGAGPESAAAAGAGSLGPRSSGVELRPIWAWIVSFFRG